MNSRLETIGSVLKNHFYKELVNYNIRYHIKKDKTLHFGVIHNPVYAEIFIDTKILKAPDEVIAGGLAHEFSHITRDNNLLTGLKDILYTNKLRPNDERMTDLDVINRGLGPELYALTKYIDKRYKSIKHEEGLTKKEIRRILKLRGEF
jgi:hypothetical protein